RSRALGASFTAAQHDHAQRAHLGGLTLVAIAVVPLTGRERAFDEHLLALLQVLADDLGLLSEDHDAMPLGAFLPFACLVGPGIVRCEREIRHGGASGGVAQLRIAAE